MSNQRISGLDALRTLAITGVTLYHMFPDTIKGGYLGVSLFRAHRIPAGLYQRNGLARWKIWYFALL